MTRCEDTSYKFFPLWDTFSCPRRDWPGSLQKIKKKSFQSHYSHSPPFLHFQENHTQCLCAFSPRLSQMEKKTGCWSALRWRNSGRLSVSILTTHGLGACTPGFSGCRHSRFMPTDTGEWMKRYRPGAYGMAQ